MRDYVDRRVTPPKRVTSPTWGPPLPCKQALRWPELLGLWLILCYTESKKQKHDLWRQGFFNCWCTIADHRWKHTPNLIFFFFFLFFALYTHKWLLKNKQLPLLEISSISALKSVLAIRLPGSQTYDHHLLTVPVIDRKRTEYYKRKPSAEYILKWNDTVKPR